jgi:hypothetical protein
MAAALLLAPSDLELVGVRDCVLVRVTDVVGDGLGVVDGVYTDGCSARTPCCASKSGC